MNKFTLLPVIGLLSMTACSTSGLKPSMFEETTVSPRNMELQQERFVEKVKLNDINQRFLTDIVGDYKRYGESPLYVVFAYAPGATGAQKAAVSNRAAVTKGQLSKMNVNAIVKTLPVADAQGDVVVAYDKLTATGPQNCGTMPGLDGLQVGSYGDYGIGCTVKDMTARQVAYPRDLRGREGLGDRFDGTRAATIVNRDVITGEVNDFVPSYVLSELASKTN